MMLLREYALLVYDALVGGDCPHCGRWFSRRSMPYHVIGVHTTMGRGR